MLSFISDFLKVSQLLCLKPILRFVFVIFHKAFLIKILFQYRTFINFGTERMTNLLFNLIKNRRALTLKSEIHNFQTFWTKLSSSSLNLNKIKRLKSKPETTDC